MTMGMRTGMRTGMSTGARPKCVCHQDLVDQPLNEVAFVLVPLTWFGPPYTESFFVVIRPLHRRSVSLSRHNASNIHAYRGTGTAHRVRYVFESLNLIKTKFASRSRPFRYPQTANCGETTNLLKCSRCHSAYFCGVQCQKQYWPFHKPACKRNEFADAVEEAEPKFAAWMRKHNKMAVMKDDEVDRLERAGAQSASTRRDVMESMYGRLDPRPAPATYSAEEQKKMKARAEEEKVAARKAAVQMISAAYQQVEVPRELGVACSSYKWRQNQTYVEIYVPIGHVNTTNDVVVELKPKSILVEIAGRPVLGLKGELYRDIKAEDSTWYLQDGILEITLLKLSRRGQYANGETNADTFWRSVVKGAGEHERLALEAPPSTYYKSHFELDVNKGGKFITSGASKSKSRT